MKYFRLIHDNVDVAPLLEEIQENEDAWSINTSRQDKISAQRDTNTIFIRNATRRPDLNVNENQQSAFSQTARLFPRAVGFMQGVAKLLNGELSRATIVRLKPRSQVYRHVDSGTYYFIRNRYHLVLHSPAGSVLESGGEQVRMKERELWWFDNKQYHSSHNESDDWRIHYIFDLLPTVFKAMAVNPLPPPDESSLEPRLTQNGSAP